MKTFIETLKAGADIYRANCAREKTMMETYGFSVMTSGGSEKDGVLFATQKSGSTVKLPEGKAGVAIAKEWKALCSELKIVRAFQNQEGFSYGHLRQLAELAEAALAAQAEAEAQAKAQAEAQAGKVKKAA